MSYCGALPIDDGITTESSTLESDSYRLVDACLSQIRFDARLDEAPVLPKLDAIAARRTVRMDDDAPSDQPLDAPRRSMWAVRGQQQPGLGITQSSPQNDVARVDVAHSDVVRIDVSRINAARSSVATVRNRSISRRMTWPVFLCGFLAGIFGGCALMKSPLADKPAVRHVAKAVRRQVLIAYAATAVAKSRIVRR